MSKFFVIVSLLGFVLIYVANYIDYKKERITRLEFDRKIRLFIFLVFICIALYFYFRRH